MAPLTGTDLPYALAATVRSSAGQIIRPAHLLAAAALFMVILHGTGRIPGGDAHRYQQVRHDQLGWVRRNCPASEILLGVSLG